MSCWDITVFVTGVDPNSFPIDVRVNVYDMDIVCSNQDIRNNLGIMGIVRNPVCKGRCVFAIGGL